MAQRDQQLQQDAFDRSGQQWQDSFNFNVANATQNAADHRIERERQAQGRDEDRDLRAYVAELVDQRSRELAGQREGGLNERNETNNLVRSDLQQRGFEHTDQQQERGFEHGDAARKEGYEHAERLAKTRVQSVSDRERQRAERSESWRALQQQNRDDDKAYAGQRAWHEEDVRDARFRLDQMAKVKSAGGRLDPVHEAEATANYDTAVEIFKSFLSDARKRRPADRRTSTMPPNVGVIPPSTQAQPVASPATQPAAMQPPPAMVVMPNVNGVPAPQTAEQAAMLPPGTPYIAPDGTPRIKR